MKVRVNLTAHTRMEYSRELEVPDAVTDSELNLMVDEMWESTCGSAFTKDWEFFEKGYCYWEKLEDE
jgi:hypothetical protein